YHGESLKNGDSVAVEREWDYLGFGSHAIWLDIPKNSKYAQVSQNKNKAEVDKILKELKQFCDWGEGRVNDEGQPYSIAILTFYKGQETALRKELQKLPDNNKKYSQFEYKGQPIKLATVDYFQGQEADLVFLSMVNNYRDGFLDSPNRLNVAITRARYQLAIVGCYDYFANNSRTTELKNLAKALPRKVK
ncbi:C-terminal helicase domain-containing protein, partial [Pseudoalteromonas sp. SR45-5]